MLLLRYFYEPTGFATSIIPIRFLGITHKGVIEVG